MELRRSGVKGLILILGYTDVREWRALARYKLTQCVVDADYAHELSAAAKRTVRVHLKVDTGMHRLGESWEHVDEIAACYRCV